MNKVSHMTDKFHHTELLIINLYSRHNYPRDEETDSERLCNLPRITHTQLVNSDLNANHSSLSPQPWLASPAISSFISRESNLQGRRRNSQSFETSTLGLSWWSRWLRLHSQYRGPGFEIPHATAKTWHSQINKLNSYKEIAPGRAGIPERILLPRLIYTYRRCLLVHFNPPYSSKLPTTTSYPMRTVTQ